MTARTTLGGTVSTPPPGAPIRPSRRRRGATRRMATAVIVAAVFCAGITALSLAGSNNHPTRAPLSLTALARRDARSFLARDVATDGRVVRHDQGGDTVSEGQGYALLVAVAIGDRGVFDRAWRWEQRNLQLPNGLFAYHWAHGRVVTHQPAADADLDTAWALVLGGRRFHSDADTTAGLRVARSIMADETVTAGGHLELVAGTWARKDPAIVDPSYLAPEAMAALAAAGAAPAWRTLADDSTTLVATLERSVKTRLPPNWARLSPNGTVTPSGADGKGAAAYGLDAQRVPVWFAADCTTDGKSVAAATWPALRAAPSAGSRISYSLGGSSRSHQVNPVGDVAAAASAAAAGHRGDARRLLAQGDRLDASYATYYGSAWLALGRILLDTDWLGSCPPR